MHLRFQLQFELKRKKKLGEEANMLVARGGQVGKPHSVGFLHLKKTTSEHPCVLQVYVIFTASTYRLKRRTRNCIAHSATLR